MRDIYIIISYLFFAMSGYEFCRWRIAEEVKQQLEAQKKKDKQHRDVYSVWKTPSSDDPRFEGR